MSKYILLEGAGGQKRRTTLRALVREIVKRVDVTNSTVLLVKPGSFLAQNLSKVAETFGRTSLKEVIFIVGEEGDLQGLDAEKMKEHGWVRDD